MARYLVVGGSSGIGAALTQRLLNQGDEVLVISRTDSSVPATHHFRCDVTEEALPDIEGVLNGIVYCPGSINLKPLLKLTIEDFQNDFAVNCLGAVRVVQAYLPLLKGQEPASILFFGTVAVERGMAFHTSIAAAKGALHGMTRSLAAELSPQVRVNCIAPSLTDTPLAQHLMRGGDALKKKHPLNRLGKADDIAAMAAFLLSDQASWITGQVVGVDGGLSTLAAL